MTVTLAKEITTGKVGVLITHDPNVSVVIINAKNFKPSTKVNYFFTLDSGVMNDLVSLYNFTEIKGGSNIKIDVYEVFRVQIDGILGSFVPNRSTADFQSYLQNLRRYTAVLPNSEHDAILDEFFKLINAQQSVEEYVKNLGTKPV